MANIFFEVSSKTIRSGSRLSVEKSIERALFSIGVIVKNQIKVNIRQRDVIQSGRLRDAINFRIEKSSGEMSLIMEARNVSYAHINEFGSNNITDKVRRAMFARLREQGVPRRPGKGVMEDNVFFGRKFVRDALDGHQGRIMAFLRDAIREIDLIERV